MIKLLFLLFTFAALYGEDFYYLLPDRLDHMSRHIETSLKSSRRTILIVTSELRLPSMRHSLIHALKRGSSLTAVVSDLKGDPIYLAQYERSEIRIYKSRPIKGSLILVDGRFACQIPGSLNEEDMKSDGQIGHCTDDPLFVDRLEKEIAPLLKRTDSYLK